MKKFVQFMVVLFTLALASLSAYAQAPHAHVFRAAYPGETHTGYLLTSWEPTVTIQEPEKLAPVVVTWSGSYRATTPFYVGVRVNDGPCVFNGPSQVPAYFPEDLSSTSVTMQWIFLPGDYKLEKGSNTITLCGASSEFGSNGTITLGLNTMTARLAR